MVEREAQLPGDRPKIAAVIYNRLRLGMPLGIDATHPLRARAATDPTYAALTEAAAALRLPLQHPPAHAACRRPRSPTRASPRSKPPRTPRTSPTSTTSRAPTAAASWCSPTTCAAVRSRTPRPTRQRSRTTAGTAAGAAEARAVMRPPRRPRLAGRAQPLAGDAQRRAARRSAWMRLALPAAAGAARALRRDRRARSRAAGFVGANVTIPHKHAALALADSAERGGARDRRGEHAHVRRGRRDRGREHRRARLARRARRLARAA